MMAHRTGVPTRTACLIAFVALAVALLSQTGSAAEVSWLNNAGGLWTAFPSNWSNGAINGPTAADDAVFDLGVTYLVSFNIFPTNNRLIVRNDDVTLSLNGSTYTLTNPTTIDTSPIDASILVGQNAGDVAQLSVINTGTLSARHMYIGLRGTGALTVNALTTLTSSGGAAVGAAGGTGTITVTGPIAQWTNNDLRLAGNGPDSSTGTLNVLAGGTVTTNSFTRIGWGGTGIATVSGAGSTWTNNSSENSLGFAANGTGVLSIEDGGAVHNISSSIGFFGNSTGMATVTGMNSILTHSGTLYVGGSILGAGGTGTLDITDQGTAETIGLTKIWAPGTVNLNGGTLTTGTLQILGAFNFTQGTLELTNSNVTIGTGAGIPGFFESTLILNPDMAVNVSNGLGDVAAGGKLLINDATSSFSANGGTTTVRSQSSTARWPTPMP